MSQGFKVKQKKQAKAHQERKNKPQQRKFNTIAQKAHAKLSTQIDSNIESICADKVLQTKQHLKIVKRNNLSKAIRK